MKQSKITHDTSEMDVIFVHSKLDDMGLDAYEFRVYGHLARRSGKDGIFPSLTTISQVCKISRPTAIKAIQGLECRKMLQVVRRQNQNNNYVLTKVSEWKVVNDIDQSMPLTSQCDLPERSTSFTPASKPRLHEGNPLKVIPKGNPIEDPVKKEAESSKSPDPVQKWDKRLLTDGWCKRFNKVWGRSYVFQGVKDGRAADRLLKIGISIDQILDVAERAWKLNEKNEWERKMAIQLSSFESQFNRIQIAVGAMKPVQSTSQRRSISQILEDERAA